jgi:serine/threonine-protein kinase haspin
LNDPKFVEYIQPLLVEGGSNEVLDFKAWANRLSKRFKIMKLAEGSFGEVFKLGEKGIGITAAPVLDAYGGCIMKVVPLNAESGPGSKKYSAIAEIVREVKLLKTMDKVPGFARFRKVHVVQGRYPDSFLEAFRDFKEEGKDCHNEDPERFSSKQLFAIIEMDDAGTDLDSLRKPSVFQVHDIFWSTVVLLANAEEQVEFEHRDLHVGNICIKPGVAGGVIEIPSELVSNMSAAPKSLLGLAGIRTTIIDYTLSRAASDPEKADVIFDPFRDASLFKAVGVNPEDKRQFETYRSMQSCVVAAHVSPRQRGKGFSKLGKNVDIWSRFVPQTNIVWLSYILHVLLFRANARIVPNSNEVAKKLQVQMYDTLEDVMNRLNVDSKTLPTSAKDLVCIAEANGWLTEEDLMGLKERLEAEQEE